jgi:hypothetical protein
MLHQVIKHNLRYSHKTKFLKFKGVFIKMCVPALQENVHETEQVGSAVRL